MLSVPPQQLHPHMCVGEDASSADLDQAPVPLHSWACVTWDKFSFQALLSDQLYSLFVFQEQLSVVPKPTLTVEHVRYQSLLEINFIVRLLSEMGKRLQQGSAMPWLQAGHGRPGGDCEHSV